MSLLTYIEKIREKPLRERYKYLYISVFLLTAAIIILWISVAFYLPKSREIIKEKIDISPFSVVKETILSAYEAIRRSQ